MSQRELAGATGLVVRTLQRYEHGEESPSRQSLDAVAQALRFPADFFLSRPPPEIVAGALSFRAYSKIRAKLRDNAVAAAQLAIELSDHLVEHFDLPALDVPDLHEEASSPEHAARTLRQEWSLGATPIPNVVHTLESHGIRVFSLSEDVVDVDAFCFWREAQAFVILNQLKSAERGRFDGSHELSHLVLHRQVDFRSKDVEREADAFAAEFLVPKEALQAQLPSHVTLDTVMKLKTYWKVSAMAMVKRLKDAGALSDWVYRGMCIKLSGMGYRRGEPGGIPNEVSSLLEDVFCSEDGMSLSEVAKALRLRQADVSPLVFRLPHERGHLRVVR